MVPKVKNFLFLFKERGTPLCLNIFQWQLSKTCLLFTVKLCFSFGAIYLWRPHGREWELLTYVTCFRILLYLNEIYCSFLWIGATKLVIFCGRCKHMTPFNTCEKIRQFPDFLVYAVIIYICIEREIFWKYLRNLLEMTKTRRAMLNKVQKV